MQCKYCNNTFKNIYTLQKHQKIALYCKAIRSSSTKITKPYKCDDCSKSYTTKDNLKRHRLTCDKLIDEKSRIIILETENKLLKSMASNNNSNNTNNSHNSNSHNTTTNNTNSNNTTNNIYNFNMSPEHILQVFDKFYLSIDDTKPNNIRDSLVRFIAENICKTDGHSTYACTDKTNSIFKYVHDNKICSDKNADKLINLITPAISVAKKDVHKKLENVKDNYITYGNISKGTDVTKPIFRTNLANQTYNPKFPTEEL